ncbi:ABC transporter permease [uncultured Microbulbifer sp.]|uniref:ABC transporter permease n=1 Tax=uncultured Microbulbifer sp. TaxID=348147 RepID=UPI0026049123|nr:ABC transporter permease [uncultured Microbulbifer sp.]
MITTKDLSIALQSLNRARSYATTIILTLGITLGALVTLFNLNYQLLAAPLPYPDEDRLYVVNGNLYQNKQLRLENNSQYPALVEIYKNDSFFESSALVYFWEDVVRNLSGSPRVNVSYVSPEYLQLAGAPLALGRQFNTDEGLDSRVPVAVISYQTWEQMFRRNPNVLEQSLQFGEVDFRIVGVTAKDFIEPQIYKQGRQTAVWLPWDFNDTQIERRNNWRGFLPFRMLTGKLKPGIDPASAGHELSTLMDAQYQAALAGRSSSVERSVEYRLTPFANKILADSTTRTLMVMGGTLVLLLIACANVTNLILSRAAKQQRTMAIQVALGAHKKHIFFALLCEIGLLMLGAALLSLLLALGSTEVVKMMAAEQIPRIQELTLNWQTLVFALLCALLLALFFSAIVSRQINYRALNQMLQSSGKGSGVQISPLIRKVLISSQVAMTSLLIVASLQIFLQANRLINQPFGFPLDSVQVMTLNIGNLRGAPTAEREGYLKAIRQRLLEHPKVQNASLSLNTPISISRPLWTTSLSHDASRQSPVMAKTTVVDENYLSILRMPLVAGRHINAAEFSDNNRMILVNETLAQQLEPSGEVLGKRFYWRGDRPYQVVGVVRNASLPGKKEPARLFVRGINVSYPLLVLKHKPHQPLSTTEINQEFAQVNRQYKVSELFSLEQARDLLLSNDRVSVWVTTALTIIALSLAAIGIFGVISYSVQLRRTELGVRLAIGARPATIFYHTLIDSLIPVVIGIALATLVVVPLALWLEQSEFSIETSLLGWLLPPLLIIGLTASVTLLSVWKIINKPAVYALRGTG